MISGREGNKIDGSLAILQCMEVNPVESLYPETGSNHSFGIISKHAINNMP